LPGRKGLEYVSAIALENFMSASLNLLSSLQAGATRPALLRAQSVAPRRITSLGIGLATGAPDTPQAA